MKHVRSINEWISRTKYLPIIKDKTDASISEYMIQEISSQLGYISTKYLDRGAHGFIYEVTSREGKISILKVTTDVEEALMCNYLKTKDVKHFNNFYDVREILKTQVDQDYEYLKQKPLPTGLYTIVSDKVSTLNDFEKKLWEYVFENNVSKLISISKDEMDKIYLTYMGLYMKQYEGKLLKYVKKISEDFYNKTVNQIPSMIKEFRKLNYIANDLHSENIGFTSDGTLVCIDPSFGSKNLIKNVYLKPIVVD